MPTSRADKRVRCPFYMYDECYNKKRTYCITCEGLVDESTLTLKYKNKQDFRIQLETFCCEYFDRCEVYRMLMQKYEENNT